MQELIGKQFSLEQNQFRIVDVRNFSGNYMVYAQKHEATAQDASDAPRKAFHFEDIAHLISHARSA